MTLSGRIVAPGTLHSREFLPYFSGEGRLGGTRYRAKNSTHSKLFAHAGGDLTNASLAADAFWRRGKRRGKLFERRRTWHRDVLPFAHPTLPPAGYLPFVHQRCWFKTGSVRGCARVLFSRQPAFSRGHRSLAAFRASASSASCHAHHTCVADAGCGRRTDVRVDILPSPST